MAGQLGSALRNAICCTWALGFTSAAPKVGGKSRSDCERLLKKAAAASIRRAVACTGRFTRKRSVCVFCSVGALSPAARLPVG
eukprot:1845800-Alexandrium_andersonii.AAC.1